jgi:hypothetical protein
MKILLSLVLLNLLNPTGLPKKASQDTILATTYYADCDGDGFGNPLISMQASSPPPTAGSIVCGGAAPVAWVLNNSDCDDRDSSIQDPIMWCADRDRDTFGDINNTFTSCNAPSGFVLDCSDCNDADAMITTQCLIPIFIDGFEQSP